MPDTDATNLTSGIDIFLQCRLFPGFAHGYPTGGERAADPANAAEVWVLKQPMDLRFQFFDACAAAGFTAYVVPGDTEKAFRCIVSRRVV